MLLFSFLVLFFLHLLRHITRYHLIFECGKHVLNVVILKLYQYQTIYNIIDILSNNILYLFYHLLLFLLHILEMEKQKLHQNSEK